jgi:putative endopeptidase
MFQMTNTMRRFRVISAVFMASLITASCALAQNQGQSSFDASQLDRSADPCVDFYQFACGGWRARNPLPSDKSRYNRYEEMSEANKKKLREILEAAAQPDAPHDVLSRQVGDYYAACVDESMADKKGSNPLDPYLAEIASLQTNCRPGRSGSLDSI